MKHPKRWDLPKGHVDEGESNKECALRELNEETGIAKEHLRIEKGFKYKQRYIVENKRGPKKKKLIIYLAELIEDVEIVPTEHETYEWIQWDPPHRIQEKTIDPLLAEVDAWWQEQDALSTSNQ
jgi:8-oxo-dGTP pyrophosphatase MutT (NUDIX family)